MDETKINRFKNLVKLIRYLSLEMTTHAASGHVTSSLSATDLMTFLFFDQFRFDFKNPKDPQNDRLIFSKGHASPLLYSLYRVAGLISDEDLKDYRQLGSPLEGHPVPVFPYVDVATGSLGQGLAVGEGMAISAKYLDKTVSKVYVLLGDGETAEGSFWEAVETASYYKLNNLIGILDVNRLGQSQETMLGHDVDLYARRISAFGWQTIIVKNGHDFNEIHAAFEQLTKPAVEKPTMIIAKTIKGKGVSFLEDKNGWHGKPLSEEEFQKAKKEIGEIDLNLKVEVEKPAQLSGLKTSKVKTNLSKINYQKGSSISTRRAFGESLADLSSQNPDLIILDGDVKNSTYTEIAADKSKDNFLELFIAEQNMIGVAAGLASRGKIPVVATFAAFLTRAFDQIRMNAISGLNIKYVGSHAGCSIGQDGPSQMGLEDISMFRSVFGSTVLYPADGVAAAKLTQEMINHEGITYLRLARPDTPIIYDSQEKFPIGGSKILAQSKNDRLVIVCAGVTVLEALTAQKELTSQNIPVCVVDCYSIKPIDENTLKQVAQNCGNKIIIVEDHWFDGGLGDAVLNVFAQDSKTEIFKMAVSQMPHSGKTPDNLKAAGIDSSAIVTKVKEVLSGHFIADKVKITGVVSPEVDTLTEVKIGK